MRGWPSLVVAVPELTVIDADEGGCGARGYFVKNKE